MRKVVVFALALALLLSLGAPALAFSAQLSAQNLTVNGKTITCEKYNIDGSNYFKLRDLAKLLNGTESQFDVGWDGAKGVVSITTNHAYTTPNGTELVVGADQSATAQVSAQTIMINGTVRSDLTVYNIGGSNFFKLREMGDALGFAVDYDAATNTAVVASSDYTPAPSASGAYPNANADGSINLDKIAHFDENFDYANKAKREKLCYIAASGTVLYQTYADAYKQWCPLYNLEWADFLSSNGDNDLYLTMLQTKLDEGIKGFILDPDTTIFPDVQQILEQYPDVFWMSQMTIPRDLATGNLINNYVGFDNVEVGRTVTERLVQWKNEIYPNIPWSEVGFLMMDFSVSPALHDRYTGSREVFLAAGGREENFFGADCVTTGLSMQGGIDAANPIVASHPEITYWLCNGLFDDLAEGAAAVFDQQGLTDTAAVCSFGDAVIQQWDAGKEDSFRFAFYTHSALYTEPIIGAVVACLNGWATPDTIWPSWVKWDDHGVGHTYSQLRPPTFCLEHDNYKQYLESVDLYTHAAETNTNNTPAPSTDNPPAPSVSGAYPNANADGSINLDKIAHFDAGFDYANNAKREKLCYIAAAGTILYQLSADAYEYWCPLFNLEWADFLSSNGDSDLYLSMLQSKIDEGVKGFILDPDSTIFPSVLSMLEKYPDVFWMSQMSAPRDGAIGYGTPVGGNLINNYVGFDNVENGRIVAERLVRWKNETYPNVPWSEVGFLMMDYSLSPALHDRCIGSHEVFLAAGGREENFFVADCVATGMSMQGGLDAASPIVASHPEITYWLCNGLFDDMAQAAAAIFDWQGLTDTAAVGTFGGSALIQQWDAGQEDSFRFAVYTAQTLYAEPIIGAVVAYLNGWATPDTIWPSWVKGDDHGVGHTYSQLRLPTFCLEHDNYKKYLEWTDLYTHANVWPYDNEVTVSINDYSPFVDKVPDDYRQP